ncbi:DUF4251 domain-containing protein [Allomuricauda sp. d1]|uniref:DUF4251 domain-containing protein n=1 Tax=Allomuricauda sp. d1 TaxID=3136725 RepID=UPI0031E3CC7D
MKTAIKFGLSVLVAFALGCTGTKSKLSAEEQQKFDRMVQQEPIEFEADWAMPMTTNSINQISNAGLLPPGSTAGRINLIGNVNYLKIKNDSVMAHLPYYGERQMGGGYNQNKTGIQFEGKAKNLEIQKDKKSGGYQIKFNISEKTEDYQVSMRVFPNLNTFVNVNSNQRFTISYQGHVKALSSDEQGK